MINAVVVFNTRYIDLAVNVLRGLGYPVRDEDPTWLKLVRRSADAGDGVEAVAHVVG